MPGTATRERPVIFSGLMVKAVLSGRKTQTRRVVRPQPPERSPNARTPVREVVPSCLINRGDTFDCRYDGDNPIAIRCPYGAPGDRLWVRETFITGYETDDYGDLIMADDDGEELPEKVWYRATEPTGFQWRDDDGEMTDKVPWKPSIHMPRWASRIKLRVEDIRVERVQSISEADAHAEGVEADDISKVGAPAFSARQRFRDLWDSINAGRGFGWEANPWVWCVTFSRVESTP